MFAFGGYVESEGRREFGQQKFSIDIFDPKRASWQRGPEVPGYRGRVVREYSTGGFGANATWVAESGESAGDPPPYETPNGTADHRGRVYWFGRIAPVYYDSLAARWAPLAALPLSRELSYDSFSDKNPACIAYARVLVFLNHSSQVFRIERLR